MTTALETKGSVLVVDDETSILSMCNDVLTRQGYRCHTVTSGEMALELINTMSFDLMLTDILMPGIGGFDLTEKAKKLNPNMLVIIMTGFAEDFSYDSAIQSGASDFIKKPFTIAELMARIKNVTLQEKLRVMSVTDELTGLFNRRGFFNLAEQQLKLARRNKKKVFILYIDVNNFKQINDRLGHHEGDVALIDTANVLRSTFREPDIIARIGGDEFVVIPVEPDTINTEVILNRLQKNFDKHNESEKRNFTLSVCVGVAEGSSSIDELLAQADTSMLEQKKLRRQNQLEKHG
ncbi:MAG: diguanylate cyclase [Nitrospiraceae bacterium]|nr:MAG: diguanylate cyclase [Nitrospiraceae bacterium]